MSTEKEVTKALEGLGNTVPMIADQLIAQGITGSNSCYFCPIAMYLTKSFPNLECFRVTTHAVAWNHYGTPGHIAYDLKTVNLPEVVSLFVQWFDHCSDYGLKQTPAETERYFKLRTGRNIL